MTGCRSTTTSKLIVRSLLFYSIILSTTHLGYLSISVAAPPVAPHTAPESAVKPGQIGDSGYVVPTPEFKMKSFIGNKAPVNKGPQPENANPSAAGDAPSGQVHKVGPRKMGPQQMVAPMAPTTEKPTVRTGLRKEPPPKLDKAPSSVKPSSPEVVENAPIIPQPHSRRRVETLREDEPVESVKEASKDLRRAPEQKTQPAAIPDPRSLVKSHPSEPPGDQYSQKVTPKSPSTPAVFENPRAASNAAQRRRLETLSDEQTQETVAANPEALRRSPEQKTAQGAGPLTKSSDFGAQPGEDRPRLPFDPDTHKKSATKPEQQMFSGEDENEPSAAKSGKSFEPLEEAPPQKQVLQPKTAFRIPAVADGLSVKSASKPERIEYQAGQSGDEPETVPMVSGRAPEPSAALKTLASSNRPAGPPQIEESAPREKASGNTPANQLAALPNSQSFPDITREDLVKTSPVSRQPKSLPEPEREHATRSVEERTAEPKPEPETAPLPGDQVSAKSRTPNQQPAEKSHDGTIQEPTPGASQDQAHNLKEEKPSGDAASSAADVEEAAPKKATGPDDANRPQSSASEKYAALRSESSLEPLPERFLKATTPLAVDFIHNREVRDYLKETSPILEELSLLMAKAPALTIADFDPSDPEASMFPKDIYIRMDALKRQLQILDSKTFSIIAPARFKDFHDAIRESISETSQACDAMIQYFNNRSPNNLQKVQDHLLRARQLIQLTRVAQT